MTTSTTLQASPASRGRVLVIDDEPAIGAMICRALGRQHDVCSTTRAGEALRWVSEGQRFDVIFCDLMMPDLTGMDLYAELLRDAPELAERVVFVTGGTFTQRACDFLDSVPNARLEKPFDMRAVQAIVRDRIA